MQGGHKYRLRNKSDTSDATSKISLLNPLCVMTITASRYALIDLRSHEVQAAQPGNGIFICDLRRLYVVCLIEDHECVVRRRNGQLDVLMTTDF